MWATIIKITIKSVYNEKCKEYAILLYFLQFLIMNLCSLSLLLSQFYISPTLFYSFTNLSMKLSHDTWRANDVRTAMKYMPVNSRSFQLNCFFRNGSSSSLFFAWNLIKFIFMSHSKIWVIKIVEYSIFYITNIVMASVGNEDRLPDSLNIKWDIAVDASPEMMTMSSIIISTYIHIVKPFLDFDLLKMMSQSLKYTKHISIREYEFIRANIQPM